jgi:hypothetical protein
MVGVKLAAVILATFRGFPNNLFKLDKSSIGAGVGAISATTFSGSTASLNSVTDSCSVVIVVSPNSLS